MPSRRRPSDRAYARGRIGNGGDPRDTLAREVPTVFRPNSALYAIPAAIGATAVTVLWPRDALTAVSAAIVVATVFVLRMLALQFNWRAPTAR